MDSDPQNNTNESNQAEETTSKRSVSKMLLVWIRRGVLFIFSLLIFCYFLLWLPPVQTWLGNQLANVLSNAWDREVRIGGLTMTPVSNVKFYDVFIGDHHQDTLLFAEYVEAVDYRVLSLFNRTIDIGTAVAEDVVFKIKRHPEEENFTISFLLRFFEGPADGPPRKKFAFSMERARLKRARFEFDDAAVGTSLYAYTEKGYVDAHDVDMIGKRVHGDTACLEQSFLKVFVYDQVPIPGIDSSFWIVPYDSTIPYWDVFCQHLHLKDFHYQLINERVGLDSSRRLDFSNLNIPDIDLHVDSFRLHKEEFTGFVNELHGIDHGGFALHSVRGRARVNPNEVDLRDIRVKSDQSNIGNRIYMSYDRYSDFFDFPNKVEMDIRLDSSTINFDEMVNFAPLIVENPFIKNNLERNMMVSCSFKGTVNDFRVRDMVLEVDPDIRIEGNMSMNDIMYPQSAFMDLSIKDLQIHQSDLHDMLSFIELPKGVRQFGNIRFVGNYTGFFQDFVAYGRLKTSIGEMVSDLKLNIRDGLDQASYSGGVRFNNFDLGAYLDNKNLGEISLRSQVYGTGMTLETLSANLENTVIDSIDIKRYVYKDIFIDGKVDKKRFNGILAANDNNISLNVKGLIDLNGSKPLIDLKGAINYIDFEQINVTKDPFTMRIGQFDINAVGDAIENFEGKMDVRGIKLDRNKVSAQLDSFIVHAIDIPHLEPIKQGDSLRILHDTTHRITMRTDVGYADIHGNYDIVNLAKSIESFLRKNHPNIFKTIPGMVDSMSTTTNLGDIASAVLLNSIAPAVEHQDFDIILQLDDTESLTQLLNPAFKSIKDLYLTGTYHGSNEEMMLNGHVGSVQFGDLTFDGLQIDGDAYQEKFTIRNTINTLLLNDTTFLPEANVFLDAIGDSVLFRIETASVAKFASNVSIKGQLELQEKMAVLHLDTSNLSFLGLDWTLGDDNLIKIGNNFLDIQNVLFSSGRKKISLSGRGQKGLAATIENMDLGWLYHLGKPLPQIELGGIFTATASIDDVFTMKGIQGYAEIDTLIINEDYWGSNTRLNVKADSLKSLFKGQMVHSSAYTDTLFGYFSFLPSIATDDPTKKNYLEVDATTYRAKAKIVEYFLEEQISNTVGTANAQARIFGKIDGPKTKLNITGMGDVTGIATSVNFLKTRYALCDGTISMDNTGFHIVPAIQLKEGKYYERGGIPLVEVSRPLDTAFVGGSLTHDHLKNFGLDIIAYFDNNLVLNTQKGDNSTFYGTVFATGTANFKGPFEKMKLKVDASSDPNSFLVLPLGDPVEVEENNYISFVDRKSEKDTMINIKEKVWAGLDIEIVAHVTPDANMQLIFDEKAGDIMEGRGFGDLTISYSSTGELKMFGDYKIEEGNYLFTYRNVLNKPFTVKKGGTIRWGDNDGDPYKAELDIEAAYNKNLSLTNLLSSYTVNNFELAKIASKPTDVSLLMDIKGELFAPDISFDIKVEDVDARIRSFLDLAIRAVRSDNNELNRQVFGIIALQQFLPLENNQNINVVSSGISTGISTLSELISQQLSLYLNDLLAQVIEDVDFISNFELDLNFNYRDDAVANIDESATSNVRVGGDVSLLDNRLRLYLGANVDIATNNNLGTIDGAGVNQNYIGGDFVVEYFVTNDGQLKIRGYNRTESTIIGRSTRTGVGLSYQKEFNSLKDLMTDMRNSMRSSKERRMQNRVLKLEKTYKKLLKRRDETENDKDKKRIDRKLQEISEKIKELQINNKEVYKKTSSI